MWTNNPRWSNSTTFSRRDRKYEKSCHVTRKHHLCFARQLSIFFCVLKLSFEPFYLVIIHCPVWNRWGGSAEDNASPYDTLVLNALLCEFIDEGWRHVSPLALTVPVKQVRAILGTRSRRWYLTRRMVEIYISVFVSIFHKEFVGMSVSTHLFPPSNLSRVGTIRYFIYK